jgi:hypothetical protein
MKARLTDTLAACALRAYPILLYAYPPAFRRDFGDAMLQAFNDLMRDACRRSGVRGLMLLWMRTLKDVVASVIIAYTREAQPLPGKLAFAAGLIYLAVLALSVGYGAVRYQEFYAAPSFSQTGAANEDEGTLLSRYAQALTGDFGEYRSYVRGMSLFLALLLGVAAGLFGVSQRSAVLGLVALASGVGVTVAAVSLLPTIWFPLDRYPVGFTWAIGAAPVGLAAWVAVMGSTRLWRPRHAA